jgi:hypothetical protein
MTQYKKMLFSGGRENTPAARIVDSNYYNAREGEVCCEITGVVSLATLTRIVEWFSEETTQQTAPNGSRYRVIK